MQPKTRDLCNYRIEKAKNDLIAAQLLLEQKLFLNP